MNDNFCMPYPFVFGKITQKEAFSNKIIDYVDIKHYKNIATHVCIKLEEGAVFTPYEDYMALSPNGETEDRCSVIGHGGADITYPLQKLTEYQLEYEDGDELNCEYFCEDKDIFSLITNDPNEELRNIALDYPVLVRIHSGKAKRVGMIMSDDSFNDIDLTTTNMFSWSICSLRQRKYINAPTINIPIGLLEKLDGIKISLAKEVLQQSPLIQDGCVLHFGNKAGKKLSKEGGQPTTFKGHLSEITSIQSYFIMPEDWGFRIIWSFQGMGTQAFSIKWADLPDIINSTSVKNLVDIDTITTNFQPDITNDNDSALLSYTNFILSCHEYGMTPAIDFEQSNKTEHLTIGFQWGDFYRRCMYVLKIIAAYSDPTLRGDIKVIEVINNKRNTTKKTTTKESTPKWIWGNKRVRYISPSINSNRTNTRHFVRPHLCTMYIKNIIKYKEYNPVLSKINHGYYAIVKWRKGTWRGRKNGNKLDMIPDYNIQKRARHYSMKAMAWLTHLENTMSISIRHAQKGGELRVDFGDGYYYLDGYDAESNTAYEFHGDIWHGNPALFSPDAKPHPYRKDTTAQILYDETMKKKEVLEEMGFNYVCIWENDWDKKRLTELKLI